MAKKGPQQPHTNDHANGDVNGHAASECLEADEISRMENAAVRCVLELAPSARSVAVAQALERNSHVQQAVKVQLASISFAEQMRARIRSVLLLSLLLITVPFSLGGIILLGPLRCFSMVLAAARELGTRWLQESQPQNTRNSRTAVVTGAHMTKGLHVCRQLRRAGWRVVAVDYDKWWMGMSRFSTSVAAFHTVPDPGRDSLGYMQAVAEVCRQEGASLLIPSAPPNHSIYDAILIDLLPSGCRSLSLSADLTAVLDDKIKFSEVCNKIGVRVPKMWSITTHDELRKLNVSSDVTNGGARFLLKCVSYDPKHRTDLFTLPATAAALEAYLKSVDISLNCPWILQQYLTGREYSCYTVADEGRIVAHSDNIASLSCLNFGHVDSREIAEWMETFCSKLKLTGQVCVDFMEDSKDGHLYSIECNPRCSTVLCAYHDSSQLGLAFTEPSAISSAVKPRSDSPPLYWFWNEVYSLSRTWELKAFFSNITGGVDAVYDSMDPLPFLALHHLQAPVLLLRNLVTGTPWTKLDLCIGKLSELGGD